MNSALLFEGSYSKKCHEWGSGKVEREEVMSRTTAFIQEDIHLQAD